MVLHIGRTKMNQKRHLVTNERVVLIDRVVLKASKELPAVVDLHEQALKTMRTMKQVTDLRAIVHDAIELFPPQIVAFVVDQLVVDVVEIRVVLDQLRLHGEDVISTLTDTQIVRGEIRRNDRIELVDR